MTFNICRVWGGGWLQAIIVSVWVGVRKKCDVFIYFLFALESSLGK
jgi:hypothetical protein